MAKNKQVKEKAPEVTTSLEAELGLEPINAEANTEIAEQLDLFPETLEVAEIEAVVKAKTESEEVKDANGRVLFRRMATTTESTTPRKTKEKAGTKKRVRMAGVPNATASNPVNLAFPADRWGLTKDVKEAMIYAASRIGGDERKKALFDQTLEILIDHLDHKFQADSQRRIIENA